MEIGAVATYVAMNIAHVRTMLEARIDEDENISFRKLFYPDGIDTESSTYPVPRSTGPWRIVPAIDFSCRLSECTRTKPSKDWEMVHNLAAFAAMEEERSRLHVGIQHRGIKQNCAIVRNHGIA